MRSRFFSLVCALAALSSLSGCTDTSQGDVALVSSPAEVNFGQVVIGQQAVTSLSITNNGEGTATLSEPSFGGSGASVFGMESRPWPFALASGASLALQVSYSPTAVGDDSATLVFSRDSDGTAEELLQVSLSGTGAPVPGADADGDGYASDQDGGDDCDDTDPNVNPGATEVCGDGVDNDCDGTTDVGADADTDGSDSCLDCDDNDINTFPGAAELCDGVDNNCDEQIDNDVAYVDWYPDGDGDGYGDESGTPVNDCAVVAGHASAIGDCDDADDTIHPNAVELCNGIDEDCDSVVPSDETDDDGDGYVECTWVGESGTQGDDDDSAGDDDDSAGDDDDSASGDDDAWVIGGDDCDDAEPARNPGAAEICDGLDNDCDNTIPADELDGDADGESPCAGDCDDNDIDIYSTADELCDAIDSDCDSSLVDEFDDYDGDGDPDCTDLDDDNDNDPDTTDCDDNNASIFTGAVDLCDGFDWDCDGSLTDGAGATEFSNHDGDLEPDCFDTDDDNDGVADSSDDCATGDLGWTSSSTTDFDGDGCQDASEDTDDDNDSDPDSSDCDDNNAGVYNGNSETCGNDQDDDCDADTTCVEVTQSQAGVTTFSQSIPPYTGSVSAAAWYAYDAGRNASSDTGLEVENQIVEMIYQEPATLGSGLFMTLFIDSNRDSGTSGNIDIDGTGFNGAQWLVEDDPNENNTTINTDGTFSNDWNWATCCNDGAVIGPLETDFCVTLTITSHSSSIAGITTYDGSAEGCSDPAYVTQQTCTDASATWLDATPVTVIDQSSGACSDPAHSTETDCTAASETWTPWLLTETVTFCEDY